MSGFFDAVATPEPRSRRRGRALLAMIVCSVAGGIIATFAVTVPTVGFAAAAVRAAGQQFTQLPAPVVDPPMAARTRIVTSDGHQIAQVFSIDRIPVPLTQVSPLLVHAVIATEDASFYSHHGVDWSSVLRAAAATIRGDGIQGGSTITQQYVKNARIAQAVVDAGGNPDPSTVAAATEQTLSRKLSELQVALATEQHMSKDAILSGYLNIAYFGRSAYGIESAAHRYFNTTAAALTLPQAALLAGLLQSPSAYDPVTAPSLASQRRTQVLTRMTAEGYITSNQAAAADAAPLGVVLTNPMQGCQAAAPQWGFVCAQALNELHDASWWADSQTRARRLAAGGLTITVTVNPALQKAATAAAAAAIPSTNRVANAAVVIRPGTGEIAAFATNRHYGTGPGATEIVLPAVPAFSPGSVFKVVTLAAALEKGIDADSTILPAGDTYVSPVFDNPPGGFHNAEGLSGWDVSVRQATELSLNTGYVQLLEKVGVPAAAAMAARLGFSSIPTSGPDAPGKKEGSFTLGARDVSVVSVANAYATFAAGGRGCVAHLVKSVALPDGTTVTNTPQCSQVVSPPVAAAVTSILQSVVSNGTGRSAALADGRPVAGKTGTAENVSASWFAGYTPQYATAVWNGDPVSPLRTLTNVLGYDKVYGSTLPAKVFVAIMTAAHKGLPVKRFPPDSKAYLLDTGPPATGLVLVPDVSGSSVQQACAMLTSQQLTCADITTGNARDGVDSGVVVMSTPQAGTVAHAGDPVSLTVTP